MPLAVAGVTPGRANQAAPRTSWSWFSHGILTLAAGAGAWWAGQLEVLDEVFRIWSTG